MEAFRILAAVDRFPDDDAVLVRGMDIAARRGVALTIVHVVDFLDASATPALIKTYRGHAKYAARDCILAAMRRLGIDPAGAEVIVEAGSPAPMLVELCNAIKPDLVVMRAHHKPWISDKRLGSSTERVIAMGGAPVLVIRQDVAIPYDRALLAVDGPDTAPEGLSLLAAIVPGAAVHMVHAVKIARRMEEAMLRVGLRRSDLSAHHDVLAQDAENHLRALASELAPRASWQVLHGEPAAALARATQDADVGLIALGPNRTGIVRRAVIGAVTRRLLRDAACDVLVGRPLDARSPVSDAPHLRATDLPAAGLRQLSI